MKEEEESDMLHANDVCFKIVQIRFKNTFAGVFWEKRFLRGSHGSAGREQENR